MRSASAQTTEKNGGFFLHQPAAELRVASSLINNVWHVEGYPSRAAAITGAPPAANASDQPWPPQSWWSHGAVPGGQRYRQSMPWSGILPGKFPLTQRSDTAFLSCSYSLDLVFSYVQTLKTVYVDAILTCARMVWGSQPRKLILVSQPHFYLAENSKSKSK
jgi:hypothetical protein